ncbi:MAG TPA: DinB family protein [Gemmatimonadaceae bacterium]
MSIGQSMIPEFDQEMATTRRVLERIPSDKGTWKPHEKSFSVGHLAQLVARMPGWITMTVNHPKLDLSQGAAYSYETTETLLADFDRNVREAREALASVTDEQMARPWSLTMGDKTLMSLPTGVVVRQNINHLVHHRGQLTVYLRLLDIPVPSVYGPTADEHWS